MSPSCASMLSYLYCFDPAMKIRSEKVGLNSWLFSPFKSRKKGWISRKKRKIRNSALRREILETVPLGLLLPLPAQPAHLPDKPPSLPLLVKSRGDIYKMGAVRCPPHYTDCEASVRQATRTLQTVLGTRWWLNKYKLLYIHVYVYMCVFTNLYSFTSKTNQKAVGDNGYVYVGKRHQQLSGSWVEGEVTQ